MRTVWLDTNVLLRFLLKDAPDQWRRVDALMRQAQEGSLRAHVGAVVVAEVCAILHHSYKMKLSEIAGGFGAMLASRGVTVEDEGNVLEALRQSGELEIDFVDAYVALRARDAGHEIASFDRDFPRKLGVTTFKF